MRSMLREIIETVALAGLLVLVLQSSVQNYRVDGISMEPSLIDADRVIVNKATYMEVDASKVGRFVPVLDVPEDGVWTPFGEPDRGDVIVFHFPRNPQQTFVKRVIGIPGDRVRLQGGVPYVNGQLVDEPYIVYRSEETSREIRLDEGKYYVLGDNRLRSDDSRHWGVVPRENIIGEAFITYWPLEHLRVLLTSPFRP